MSTGYVVVSTVNAAEITGGTTVNDYADTTGYGFARLQAGVGGATITGFAGGFDGKRMVLVNAGANTITIPLQDTGSAAANRVQTLSGASIVLLANNVVELLYDGASAFWREI